MGTYTTLRVEVAVTTAFREDWQKLRKHNEEHNPDVSWSNQVPSVPEGFDHPLFKTPHWDFNSEPAFYAVGEILIAAVNMKVKNYNDECELLLDWMSGYLIFDKKGVPLSWDLTGTYGIREGDIRSDPIYPVVWIENHLEIDYRTNLNPDYYGDSPNITEPSRWKSRFSDDEAEGGELEGRGMVTIDHRPLPLRLATSYNA